MRQICEEIFRFGLSERELNKLIAKMNDYLQTEVFGTKKNRSHHQYIKLGKNYSIETICMSNNNCRKCFKKIDGLIDVIFNVIVDRSRYDRIKEFATSYSQVMEKLWIDKSYNTTEINDIQKEIDNFMDIYKSIWGDRLTNYFHYLDSGHVAFFLHKYKGNIMQYANQGWEGLNAWFKMVIKTKTQRGGNAGKKGREYLATACRKFSQRRLIWIFGYKGPEIEKFTNERNNVKTVMMSRIYSIMRSAVNT